MFSFRVGMPSVRRCLRLAVSVAGGPAVDDVVLTGYTEPFGMIGCRGVGPSTLTNLIGKTVDELSVIDGEFVAIDSGENRLAFPVGGPSAKGSLSVEFEGVAELQTQASHVLSVEPSCMCAIHGMSPSSYRDAVKG